MTFSESQAFESMQSAHGPTLSYHRMCLPGYGNGSLVQRPRTRLVGMSSGRRGGKWVKVGSISFVQLHGGPPNI